MNKDSLKFWKRVYMLGGRNTNIMDILHANNLDREYMDTPSICAILGDGISGMVPYSLTSLGYAYIGKFTDKFVDLISD